MKKIAFAAAVLLASALPAFAAVLTVRYDFSGGASETWTYDETSHTLTAPSGATATYTLDETAKKLCAPFDGKEVCVNFSAITHTVGETVDFTITDGRTGKATLVSAQ